MRESQFQQELREAREECWRSDDAIRREGRDVTPIEMGTEQLIEQAIYCVSSALRVGNRKFAFHGLHYLMQAAGKIEIEVPF